jgi:hypothetical protein
MSRTPNGQPIRLTATASTLAGVLVDDATLALTVQKPDATTQTYSTPTHDSTGTYHQDIPGTDLTQNGHYLYKWTAAATNVVAPSFGDFDVFDPFEPAVLPLADAKDALNIGQATDKYDNEIQAYVATIEADLEKLIGGPIVNRTISNERVHQTYTNPRLALRQKIVQSVTSIVDEWSGASMDVTSVVVDQVTNMASRKGDLPFLFRGPWCLVTYVAGLGTAVPAGFNPAARIILQHLWQTQRGPGLAPVPNMDETFLPGMAYAIPNRALDILQPYLLEVYI